MSCVGLNKKFNLFFREHLFVYKVIQILVKQSKIKDVNIVIWENPIKKLSNPTRITYAASPTIADSIIFSNRENGCGAKKNQPIATIHTSAKKNNITSIIFCLMAL